MDDDRDHASCSSDGRKRPYKVWDSRRYTKKGLVAGSLQELLNRGRDRLRYDAASVLSAVLESDGTVVDDAEYFALLPANTVFLLLRDSERWFPPGVDVLRAALTCIPRIVCQTMHALELRDEAPSWKIADHRGQVTIQLHWDGTRRDPATSPSRRAHIVVRGVGESPFDHPKSAGSPGGAAPGPPGRGREEPPPPYAQPPPPARLLTRQGSSVESSSVHVHTAECGPHHHPNHHHVHQHHGPPAGRGSPPDACDFHCCALHAGGTAIATRRSTATSPIRAPPPPPPARRSLSHVRFDEAAKKDNGPAAEAAAAAAAAAAGAAAAGAAAAGAAAVAGAAAGAVAGPSRAVVVGDAAGTAEDSSESDGDNTANEEGVTEKLLLLVDQLSVERMRYLSIKDIGIILERLSSKILDVERMEREVEGDDCRTWSLKATIRGDVLREIGVVYHGHYYSIGEHPRSAPPPADPPPPPPPQ